MNEVTPSLEEFRTLAATRRVIPVYRRLLADAETAIGLYRKLAGNRRGSYLLESAEQGVWSRYSFIGVRAAATVTEHDGRGGVDRPSARRTAQPAATRWRPFGRRCGCCTRHAPTICRRSPPAWWDT